MRGLISLAVLIAFALAWVLTLSAVETRTARDVTDGVGLVIGLGYLILYVIVIRQVGHAVSDKQTGE
jgi:predicted Co/Zn/Cd cation transporter (cation efflux family)